MFKALNSAISTIATQQARKGTCKMKKLTLKIGMYCYTRESNVLGPLESNDDVGFPFKCASQSYRSDGSWFYDISKFDLIDEAPNPVTGRYLDDRWPQIDNSDRISTGAYSAPDPYRDLRERAALASLQGQCAHPEYVKRLAENIAKNAWADADAFVSELEKRK